MSGYANRIIRTEYPDLGEKVYVEYRNPRTASSELLSPEGNGNLTQRQTSYLTIANLLRNWHVYDATVDDDEPPELTGPATPEMVARMPFVIVNDILGAVAAALKGPR